MSGVFILTDGYTSIDMLKLFCLVDWTPATPQIKGEGTWRSSPFTQGRYQVLRQYGNVIDTLTFVAEGKQSIDQLIRNTQELRRLLEKAAQYWLLEWQNEPVWIETRGVCETNTRYAVIHDYRAPGDDNPFAPPFTTSGIFNDFALILEHGIWQDTAPGSPACIEISGTSNWCFPYYLEFDGEDDEIDCGSDASIDDLPSAGDFTAEAWIYASDWGENDSGRIFSKYSADGWRFGIDSSVGLLATAVYDITNAVSQSGTDDFTPDNAWHHVAAVWDNATKTWSLYIDGVEPGYTLQQAGNAAYQSDAANSLIIGDNPASNRSWDGKIGWCRISDIKRYTVDFPAGIPARCKIPSNDTNTLAVWIYEGDGITADNREGTAALDGTIAGATWGCDCECA